jgi:hypothetical protein
MAVAPGGAAAPIYTIKKKKLLLWGREEQTADGGTNRAWGYVLNAALAGVAGVQPVFNLDSVQLFVRWDKKPSFSSGHSTRLQRVLEVASNRLLSEKVCV